MQLRSQASDHSIILAGDGEQIDFVTNSSAERSLCLFFCYEKKLLRNHLYRKFGNTKFEDVFKTDVNNFSFLKRKP